jgi:hypothetical protein
MKKPSAKSKKLNLRFREEEVSKAKCHGVNHGTAKIFLHPTCGVAFFLALFRVCPLLSGHSADLQHQLKSLVVPVFMTAIVPVVSVVRVTIGVVRRRRLVAIALAIVRVLERARPKDLLQGLQK